MVRLGEHAHDGSARSAFGARLDQALPILSIATKEYARSKRMMVNPGGEPFPYDPKKTPYSDGIMDALDDPKVRLVLVKGNTRSGKALALWTPLPTPGGWTTMGEVAVGDWLIGADGRPCRVTFATEVQDARPCYRVTFSDGSCIVADADHLWKVEKHVMRRAGTNGLRTHDWQECVLRTADMVGRLTLEGSRRRFRVRNAQPIDLPDAQVPIDPYVLGCWLGDGTARSSQITCAETDSEILNHLRKAGVICQVLHRTPSGTLTVAMRLPISPCAHDSGAYADGSCKGCRQDQYVRRRDGMPPRTVPNLTRTLRQLGVLRNKHVPAIYLRSSREQRLSLLQGMLDTDGTCSPNGSVSFTSTEPRLAEAVYELAASLGFKPTRRTREAWCYVDGDRRRGADAHVVSFRAYSDEPVFRLTRKIAALPSRSNSRSSDTGTRRIVGIDPVDSEPVRCIQVDNRDHLFLAGRAMIPTHNTVAAENFALKRWTYGPATNVIWFVQDEDSLNDYIDERGDEVLRIHPEINEKVNWGERTTGRKRKNIGRSKVFYRPATPRALRMKAAPLIIGDEVDAWTPKARDAAPTLITSRQEEFGSAAKAFLASHADAGPDGGIDKHLKDSLLHLWWVRCPHCSNAMSPAQEAEDTGARLTWNVPDLMARAASMERNAFLKMVERDVCLVCPHDGCHATFTQKQRRALMAEGQWLQPHQKLLPDGTVEGEPDVQGTMGFVIHAFMAPFVKLWETARDWAAAMLAFEDTGSDIALKEVVVKKLGETYFGAKADEVVESDKIVQARLASRYQLKTVPAGCRFLTAFVDVQGDRFEVRVIGWDLGKQSWLIDAFAIKQWPRAGEHGAFDNIDPGGRLSDWDIVEEAVITATYPLADNDIRIAQGKQPLYLPIARTMIDAVGNPGVTANARAWLSNLFSRQAGGGKRIIDGYRVALVHGASSKKAPLYGKPVPVEIDDVGRQRVIRVFERYPNVHELKRIIARRMRIDEPGPGRMNLPANISARYAKELVAERMRNGSWVKVYRNNETWDGWVMCEVARETLKPDRPGLWTQIGDDGLPILPEWAEPRPRGESIDAVDSGPAQAVNVFDRLAAINAGISGELER